MQCCGFDPDLSLRKFAVHLQTSAVSLNVIRQLSSQHLVYITASEAHVEISLTIIMQSTFLGKKIISGLLFFNSVKDIRKIMLEN